jgi:hypothetical protein
MLGHPQASYNPLIYLPCDIFFSPISETALIALCRFLEIAGYRVPFPNRHAMAHDGHHIMEGYDPLEGWG